jgi:arsenite-transporting ATPase
MGKGGVGKTTVSAAFATWMAKRGRKRVLLLSTDPAHSLADVLQVKLGSVPRQITLRGTGGRLHVWQLDAQRRFSEFLRKYRKVLATIIESGTIFQADEVEPLLESTLPGMAEIAGLLAIDDALNSGKYDQIVVDTAPFGHTLRLLEMPQAFARLLRFLEIAASRDEVLAAHFGGRVQAGGPAVLQEWRKLVEQIVSTLRERARLVLVTTAEPFALNESVRVPERMKKMEPPLRFAEIVLNRVVLSAGRCKRCSARVEEAKNAKNFLRRRFARTKLRIGEDPGFPLLGSAALAVFGEHVFQGREIGLKVPAVYHGDTKARNKGIQFKSRTWPSNDAPLTLTLGKGGVGKTTVSAGLAFHARRTAHKEVAICSTDPAPSLDDVFEQKVGDELRPVLDDPKLHAAEIDAASEFESWAARMKESVRAALAPTTSGGLHVDLSFEREMFEALLDIVPPGVDEIFGVLRISEMGARGEGAASRVSTKSKAVSLIIDMAPTGHALELLRTPARMLLWSRLLLKTLAVNRTLPLAREFIRNTGAEIAVMAARVRELVRDLRDARHTAVMLVALAEPLPDRETARLVRDLAELGLPPAALFVNRVLFAEDVQDCARCRTRREWQMGSLRRLQRESKCSQLFVIREQARGISGRKGLEEFTRVLYEVKGEK